MPTILVLMTLHNLKDMADLQVQPTPTIAVLSTGDELVEPTTESLSRGQVLSDYLRSLTFVVWIIVSKFSSSQY